VTNLLGNQLDAESAEMLAEVAKQKGISLCGIRRDQTTADFFNKRLDPPDAILLASDLSQSVVTGGLKSLDLSKNALCGVVRSSCGVSGTYTAEGIKAIADALRVNGTLTQVLAFRLSLRCLFSSLTLTFALNGITAGPLRQPAVRPRSLLERNLHCRRHHSICRCSVRQWRIDKVRPQVQQHWWDRGGLDS
jgi:hypothetical protein